MNLDEPAGFPAVDPSDALGDVEATGAQWAQARAAAPERMDLGDVDAVVVTGMGGSGIAGDVVAALALPRLSVPVVVHKGYDLPGFVGPRTLVVACSYSGATEETLSAVDAALARRARVLGVTTGGALAERCRGAGQPVAEITERGRMPRHALGFVVVPVLVALGLDDGLDEAVDVLDAVAAAAGRHVPAEKNPAKQLGLRLASGCLPVAWGARGITAVAATRLKCQLNENAKLLALAAELPELDHNDIVGFQHDPQPGQAVGLVLLRDREDEHPRVARRFAVTEELVRSRLAWVAEVAARGTSPLARLASLLLLADLASVYTAIELDRDPTPIPGIDALKRALAA